MVPEDLRHFPAVFPRRRELIWMAIVVGLSLYLLVVGPLDMKAHQVRHLMMEEEGARAVERVGEVIADRHSSDPRDLPRRDLSMPLRCLPPQAQWIRQWGDGRSPFERHPGGGRPFRCVSAEQRIRYAP